MMNMTFKNHPKIALAIGIVFAVLVEMADYLTGVEINFSIFYLLVVIYFTWSFGKRYGNLAAVLAGIVSVVTDMTTGAPYSHYVIPIWTAFMRTSLFLIVVFLLSRLGQELKYQKENNERLLRAYEEIQKLAKVKDNFTAMVSHELRTPLAAIRESISIVYDGLAGPVSNEQKEFLEMSQRNIDRLGRLIDDVLDFFKGDTGKRKYLMAKNEIRDLMNKVVAFYTPLANKKGLAFEYQAPLNLPKIVFDMDSMDQVFSNLVGNAIKFTKQGAITIGAKLQKGYLLVFVKDTGIGIADDDIKRLFKPFEQIMPHSEGGTGLGLAISKQIIDQHHGKIWAESIPGKGTAFFFTLPLRRREVTL